MTFLWVKLSRIALAGADTGDKTTAVVGFKRRSCGFAVQYSSCAQSKIDHITCGEAVGGSCPSKVTLFQPMCGTFSDGSMRKRRTAPWNTPRPATSPSSECSNHLCEVSRYQKMVVRRDPVANQPVKAGLLQQPHRVDKPLTGKPAHRRPVPAADRRPDRHPRRRCQARTTLRKLPIP